MSLPGNHFEIGAASGTGVSAYSSSAVKSKTETRELSERLMPVRIMVDGQYAKVYVGERRVANMPNGQFTRSDGIYCSVARLPP